MFMSGFRLVERLAPLAAIGAGLLGLSYFFLDGLPKPWFVPSIAFGGSIDMGLFLAAASVVLVVSQFMQWNNGRTLNSTFNNAREVKICSRMALSAVSASRCSSASSSGLCETSVPGTARRVVK